MTKFNVHVFQQVLEEAWIEVEAATEEAAQNAAVQKVLDFDASIQWSYLETSDTPVDVVDCQIITDSTP